MAADYPPADATAAQVAAWYRERVQERVAAGKPVRLEDLAFAKEARPLVCLPGPSKHQLASVCGKCGARGHKQSDRVCPFSFAPIFDGATHLLGGCRFAPKDPNDPRIVRRAPTCAWCIVPKGEGRP